MQNTIYRVGNRIRAVSASPLRGSAHRLSASRQHRVYVSPCAGHPARRIWLIACRLSVQRCRSASPRSGIRRVRAASSHAPSATGRLTPVRTPVFITPDFQRPRRPLVGNAVFDFPPRPPSPAPASYFWYNARARDHRGCQDCLASPQPAAAWSIHLPARVPFPLSR